MAHGKGLPGLESDCGIIPYLNLSVNCGNMVWGTEWRVRCVPWQVEYLLRVSGSPSTND